MIYQAGKSDAHLLAELSVQLWPHHSVEEMEREYKDLLDGLECGIFIYSQNDKPVGFAQCQLRHDYVEGTQSDPVGYLEGIFVLEEYRHKGLAGELLAACEDWAKQMGCSEFASDCELSNEASRQFHLKNGFKEANRIICFAKQL